MWPFLRCDPSSSIQEFLSVWSLICFHWARSKIFQHWVLTSSTQRIIWIIMSQCIWHLRDITIFRPHSFCNFRILRLFRCTLCQHWPVVYMYIFRFSTFSWAKLKKHFSIHLISLSVKSLCYKVIGDWHLLCAAFLTARKTYPVSILSIFIYIRNVKIAVLFWQA